MSYYHYTKGCHLPSIVKDGIIKTSKVLLDKKEKPAAWLTKSPIWETACNIGQVLNTNELVGGQTYSADEVQTITSSNDYMKKEIGMCRIVISDKLPVISWAKFKHVSRISEAYYDAIDTYSRSIGSPVDEWICTFKAIPKRYWEGIEMYVDEQWVRWDEKINIQEFVNLCLSCNGKLVKEELINGFSKSHAQSQLEFMEEHKAEIIDIWEANKHKQGYIEIYITPNYNPYPTGFRFIEKRINKSSFKPLWKSATNTYALVHFLWEATFTQYKTAFAY